jgi:hypothetical protein
LCQLIEQLAGADCRELNQLVEMADRFFELELACACPRIAQKRSLLCSDPDKIRDSAIPFLGLSILAKET